MHGLLRGGRRCAAGAAAVALLLACEPSLDLDKYVITDRSRCGNALVDTTNDPNHCGACGKQCPSGGTCTASKCLCLGNSTDCGTTCADLTADVEHCGQCGHGCSIAGAQQSCSAGSCQASGCLPGRADCNGDLPSLEQGNGCETDTAKDPLNCGGCGVQCPTDKICAEGQCVCDTPGAGGECDPRTLCGCAPNGNCIFVKDQPAWRCVPAGPSSPGSTCTASEQCARGSACVVGVCQPYCKDSGDGCPTICRVDHGKIDGWNFCAPICMPVPGHSGPTCKSGQQCVVGSKNATTCVAPPGTAPMGSSCDDQHECASGSVCMSVGCRQMCIVSVGGAQDCPGNSECVSFSSGEEVYVGDTEIGWCRLAKQCNESCDTDADCAGSLVCQHWTSQTPSCAPAQCENCQGTCYFNNACAFDKCVPS